MNQKTSKQIRILAIALTARGFGYCVMQNNVMLECGKKEVKGNKNLQSVSKIEKLMNQFLPSVLVLQDVNATSCRRAPRIKALYKQVIELAAKQKCKVTLFTGEKLRTTLVGNVKGTKYQMAESLAQKYPTELAAKLPPKRRLWESESGRMDIFDGVALAVVFRLKQTKCASGYSPSLACQLED
jgi:Holliday junction resolvasome RuvABC endonuclease subunit